MFTAHTCITTGNQIVLIIYQNKIALNRLVREKERTKLGWIDAMEEEIKELKLKTSATNRTRWLTGTDDDDIDEDMYA